MRRAVILSLILMPLFVTKAFADTSIEAEIDKRSLTAGQALTYKLTIVTNEKEIPRPELPKFAGFKVVSTAQSSTVSYEKDGIKTVITYIFALLAVEAGKFKIEPAVIKIKNEKFSTAEFEIEVAPGQYRPEKDLPQTQGQPRITL